MSIYLVRAQMYWKDWYKLYPTWNINEGDPSYGFLYKELWLFFGPFQSLWYMNYRENK